MSRPATGTEQAAADLLDNCDGNYKDAVKYIEKMKSHLLDRVHAEQGFDRYKELKQGETA